MEPTKIPQVDELIDKVEDPLNTIVDMNNDLNDAITKVKDAVASVSGAYRMQFALGTATDTWAIDLVKAADNTKAPAEAVAKLAANPQVASADKALSQAEENLQAALERAGNAKLSVSPANELVCDGASQEAGAFNAAVASLGAALGKDYKLVLTARATTCPGASIVKAQVVKPVFANDEAEHPDWKPVSFMDIAKQKNAVNLRKAQAGILAPAEELAKKSQDVEGYSIEFIRANKKLALPKRGAVEDKAKAADLRKAINNVNSQAFKLIKECNSINGEVGVVTAIVKIVEMLQKKVMDLSNGAGKDAINFNPKFNFDADMNLEFDLGITLKGIDMPEFPDCLPGPAKMVYDVVMEAKDAVVAIAGRFPELKEQFEQLLTEVQEFDVNAALEELGEIDMMEKGQRLMAVTKALTGLVGSRKIITTVVGTGQRVGVEFQKAYAEMQKLAGIAA